MVQIQESGWSSDNTYTHSREVEWPDSTIAAELMNVLVL
jgi:hypothetical protein